MKLITNNPKFVKENFKNIEVEYLDVSYLDVLKKVRDYVHDNWEIVTHPLYGSVKPNETIYRSVLIKKNEELDVPSVNLYRNQYWHLRNLEIIEKFLSGLIE